MLGWVAFALARVLVRDTDVPRGLVVNPVPLPPTPVSQASRAAVVDALLSYGKSQAPRMPGKVTLTPDPAANVLVIEDPFAFLLAVIFDQGIPAERGVARPRPAVASDAPHHRPRRPGEADLPGSEFGTASRARARGRSGAWWFQTTRAARERSWRAHQEGAVSGSPFAVGLVGSVTSRGASGRP